MVRLRAGDSLVLTPPCAGELGGGPLRPLLASGLGRQPPGLRLPQHSLRAVPRRAKQERSQRKAMVMSQGSGGHLPGRLPVLSLGTRMLAGNLEGTVPFLGTCQSGQDVPEQSCLGQQQLWPWLTLGPGPREKVGPIKVALDPLARGKCQVMAVSHSHCTQLLPTGPASGAAL